MSRDGLSLSLFLALSVAVLPVFATPGFGRFPDALDQADVATRAPSARWVVAQGEDGFHLWALGLSPLPGYTASPARSSVTQRPLCQDLQRAVLHPDRLEEDQKARWSPAALVPAPIETYLGRLAAVRLSGRGLTVAAVVVHGGGTRLLYLSSFADEADMRTADQKKPARKQTGPGNAPDWLPVGLAEYRGVVHVIDWPGAPEGWCLDDLTYPSLAQLGDGVFIGGQSFYPGNTAERAVWVAKVRQTHEVMSEKRLDGVLIGEGRAPTFMAMRDRLWCLAIRKVKPGTMLEGDLEGRVVGWTSGDGAEWEDWDPGITMHDVVSVDGCADAERGFVACISGFPAPVIRLYEIDQDSGSPLGVKLREVHSFEVPEPEGVDRRVVVRVLDSTPYVFWSRTEDEKTTIYMRRIDLSQTPPEDPPSPPATSP